MSEIEAAISDFIDDDDDLDYSIDNSWLFIGVGDMSVGVPVKHVTEMVPVDTYTEIPDSPAYIRGMAQNRGRVLPTVDLRIRLGMADRCDTVGGVVEELALRKQDHIEWLEELRASVEEDRAFEKTTDPHACAFGMWYDSYQTDNHDLQAQMKKFDAPHQKIHAVAIEIEELIANDRREDALKRIEETWDNELRSMIELFDQTYDVVCDNLREILVVLAEDIENPFCIIAETIEGVRHEVEIISTSGDDAAVYGLKDSPLVVGLCTDEDTTSVLLDIKRLM